MEKVSEEGTYLGSLQRALIVLKIMCISYENIVDLSSEYDLGENLAFQNLL